jgi:hypothetical protein
MSVVRIFRPRTLFLITLVLLLAAVTYGFAAANTMPTVSNAGDGSVTVSGYTVSNIHYNLVAGNPRNVASVTFDLAPDDGGGTPASVQARLGSSAGWSACTETATPGTWNCVASGTISVLSVDELTVVAAD